MATHFRCLLIGALGLVLLSGSAIGQTDLEGNWGFNWHLSGSQVLLDDSTNGNHLIRGSTTGIDGNDPGINNPDVPQPANGNYSTDYDGVNDYAYRTLPPSLKPTGEFTLATWVKLDTLSIGDQDVMISCIGPYGATGGYQLLFANPANPNVGISYRDAGGADRGIGVALNNPAVSWQAGVWYHVTGTYDAVGGGNSEVKVFIDGRQMAAHTDTGQVSYHNTNTFWLGTNYDGDGGTGLFERELDGHLDNTQVWSDELTDNEIRDLAQIDLDWDNPGTSGDGSIRTNWYIPKLPGYASNVRLPSDATPYTVRVDGDWEVRDITVENNATGHLDGFDLQVGEGGQVQAGGTLHVEDAVFTPDTDIDVSGTLKVEANPGHSSTVDGGIDLLGGGELHLLGGTVSGIVDTENGTAIRGYGTVSNGLNTNRGMIRAEGSGKTLNVSFDGNDIDHGTLSATAGATLNIADTAAQTNKATIDLDGGDLTHTGAITTLTNENLITGSGHIKKYQVNNASGTIQVDAPGDVLTIEEGFDASSAAGVINVTGGGELSIGAAWNNDANVTMNNGSITGQEFLQRGTLTSRGAAQTNTLQNVKFDPSGSTVIRDGSTLTVSGVGDLNGATIFLDAGGGTLATAAAATIKGSGLVHSAVMNLGTFRADVNAATLTVNGTVNNQNAMYATSGGTLDINGAVTNDGELYASGAGVLRLDGAVHNRGNVKADGGTVNVGGTIKSGPGNDGDFSATSGLLAINAPLEYAPLNYNTFTANGGGTIKFADDLDTGNLSVVDALRPRGGTITLRDAGETLTNAPGKTIAGTGTLLEENRNLVNRGVIEADGGSLNVHGDITNYGTMRACAGDSLAVNSTLAIDSGGSIYAADGGSVTIGSSLDNDGEIYAAGGGQLTVQDTAPTGSGTFDARAGGTIQFVDGFSNASLTRADALQLDGGRITVMSGQMTNANGMQIVGSGTLLGGKPVPRKLINEGEIIPGGGAIWFADPVENAGTIYADGADSVVFSANLDVKNGGVVSLTDTQMLCGASLSIQSGGYLVDNGSPSTMEVRGSLTKYAGAESDFDGDQVTVEIYSIGIIAVPHTVQWEADDVGADVSGLDDNLALGSLIFGDGLGGAMSDSASLGDDTTIYTYGLSVLSDARLDLAGRTIYYVIEGYEHNGIVGTGLLLEGNVEYNGGALVPIPEPATLSLLALGSLVFLRRRRR
ncbi:MAG: PEP-CTERM sorting domain-containing protein [Phycisphaerae bacterium]|nr:PEP-CTERM sorting domain-containing protein [Phycisphaerae bacterium]